MASYQYTRDIKPEDLQPEAPRQYTKKEKWANWWDYHLSTVLIVGFFAALGIWMLTDVLNKVEPDYSVAVVVPGGIPTGVTDALAEALTPYATDLNGDGEVVVQCFGCNLNLSDTEELMDGANPLFDQDAVQANDNMAAATVLAGDFSANRSYLFLLYDPAGFARYTQGLVYLDGTLPAEIDTGDLDALKQLDWYNMVYRWTDCPVLAALEPGEYTDPLTGTAVPVTDYLEHLYVARRVVVTEESAKAFAGADAFWQAITAGASSTAGQGTHWKAEAGQ